MTITQYLHHDHHFDGCDNPSGFPRSIAGGRGRGNCCWKEESGSIQPKCGRIWVAPHRTRISWCDKALQNSRWRCVVKKVQLGIHGLASQSVKRDVNKYSPLLGETCGCRNDSFRPIRKYYWQVAKCDTNLPPNTYGEPPQAMSVTLRWSSWTSWQLANWDEYTCSECRGSKTYRARLSYFKLTFHVHSCLDLSLQVAVQHRDVKRKDLLGSGLRQLPLAQQPSQLTSGPTNQDRVLNQHLRQCVSKRHSRWFRVRGCDGNCRAENDGQWKQVMLSHRDETGSV